MFAITFFPRSKRLLILWLQSPSTVILETKKIKSVTVSIISPPTCHEVMEMDAMILVFWMSGFKLGEGNGNPLQYSCLENPGDREAWWALVYGVAQSQARLKWLSSSSSSSSFKPAFSFSSFTFNKRLFSSSSLSAIRVVSSAYLRLFIFLLAVFIQACSSSSPAFHMMYSALS